MSDLPVDDLVSLLPPSTQPRPAEPSLRPRKNATTAASRPPRRTSPSSHQVTAEPPGYHKALSSSSDSIATARARSDTSATSYKRPPLVLTKSGIAAGPRNVVFDPWNAYVTGHQRAEWGSSGGLAAYRQMREGRWAVQFGDGVAGRSKRDVEGRQKSLVDYWAVRTKGPHGDEIKNSRKLSENSKDELSRVSGQEKLESTNGTPEDKDSKSPLLEHLLHHSTRATPPSKKIFRGLTIYINGSTAPHVSDHRLKQLLTRHGAHTSLALMRRQVTHVILGNREAGGGGLAAGKVQREMEKKRVVGVKYVGVEWVLESIKAGKRLPETRYAKWRIAADKQASVLDMLG